MSKTIVKVENVSKKYCRTLKHTMLYGTADLTRSFFGFKQHTGHIRNGEFWSVNDVSFELKRGECLGLIGPNGSGKSTLLKMLNGIFMPDKGRIEVIGRVGALIEVGAGFHPMLTGRENVYVNGAILGMSKKEIDKKFDEIVDFAGIEDFIDSPVKHYSSGMYVRLGFAVAAHAEPDVLLTDEVLAVGDEAFQKKCFSRLEMLKENGVATIMVSHSMSLTVQLCDSAVLIDKGEMISSGSPKSVVSNYHKIISAPEDIRDEVSAKMKKAGNIDLTSDGTELELDINNPHYDPTLVPDGILCYESRGAVISNATITTINGEVVNILRRGEEYIYSYDVSFTENANSIRFGMLIKTTSGLELGGMVSHSSRNTIEKVSTGFVLRPRFKFRCSLLPGVYFLNAGVMGVINGEEIFLHRCFDIAIFRVQEEGSMQLSGIVDLSISYLNVESCKRF